MMIVFIRELRLGLNVFLNMSTIYKGFSNEKALFVNEQGFYKIYIWKF